MSLEYNGTVYNSPKKYDYGEIDPAYPEKQQPYVQPEIDCAIHNHFNGWKCINCGALKKALSR